MVGIILETALEWQDKHNENPIIEQIIKSTNRLVAKQGMTEQRKLQGKNRSYIPDSYWCLNKGSKGPERVSIYMTRI